MVPTTKPKRPPLRRAGPALALGVGYCSHGYIYLGCHKGLYLPAFQPNNQGGTWWGHHGWGGEGGGALARRSHGLFLESCIAVHYPSQQNFLSHRDNRSLSQGYTASGFQPRFAFRDHHLLLLIVSIKLGNNPITHIR